MDIPKSIPKFFWYSLSIAILIVSIGLTYIAYRSSTVTIELANTKINLSSEVASSTIALNTAIDEAENVKKEAEKKYNQLFAEYERIKTQLDNIKEQSITADVDTKELINKLTIKSPDLSPTMVFKDYETSISRAQKSLKNLESMNKQMQMAD
jgi:hypothetical protein